MQEKEVSIITEEDKELEREEYKDFKENAELKAIIANSKAKRVFVTQGDIQIFIRGSLPKGLRDRIIFIAKEYESGDIETADDKVYEIMAEICLDSPYNKPEVWAYIDRETGEVPGILKQMIEKIAGAESAAKRFR